MKLIPDGLRKAMQQMIFPSSYGTLLTLPRTGYNFSKDVDGYQSAIIMACVNWILRTFPEAPVYLRQRNADGSWDDKYDHAMLELLDTPNPFYDGLLLQGATIADYTIDGNAYWRKIRSAAKRVVQLWWIPSPLIEPRWGWNNTDYITHYEYLPAGYPEKIAPEDIVHFRYGLDPNNIRKGLAPLKSLFREVFTDDEAANMTASLLRNLGVPGVVISPKEGSSGMTKERAQEVKDYFKESFTGDKRGEPLIMSGSTSVEQFGFSPQQMDLKALRQVPEERISGVLGVPAIVAGLGAGLARSTFANFAEAREMAYESNIIPSQRVFGSVIKRQLLSEFEDEIANWQVAYDLKEVRVLQEDENKKAERVGKMVLGGYVTVSNAQRETGMPVDETQNIYLRPLMMQPVPAGTKAAKPEAIESKSDGLTEEMKDILWKRVDRRRVAWWGAASKKIEPLYEAEAEAVEKAIKGKAPNKLIDAAEKAIEGLRPEWEKMITALSTAIIEDFGNEVAEDLGAEKSLGKAVAYNIALSQASKDGRVKSLELKWTFDPMSAIARAWIVKNGTVSIKTILATNLEDVKTVILAGVDENVGTTQIARNLRRFYTDRSPFKAMRVARTETSHAAGFGQQEAARQSGVVKTRSWISSRDDRVRDEHILMDTDENHNVPFDEPYSDGSMYPGEQDIMCRCVETYGTGR